MNLYELSEQMQRLLDLLESVDTTQEEYKQVYLDTLESVTVLFEEKAEGYAMVRTQLKADEEAVDYEIKRLQAKKTALANNRKRLEQTLQEEMIATNQRKIKTPLFSIYIQKNPPSVQVTNEEIIPEDFYIPQPDKLDKASIKECLKRGIIVPGVELVSGESIRFK